MRERPTVVQVCEPYDVYIGRAVPRRGFKASRWGNPYRIGRDGTADEVLAKYREHALAHPDLVAALPSLRGRRLACWCKGGLAARTLEATEAED